jgi:hypothetical protein
VSEIEKIKIYKFVYVEQRTQRLYVTLREHLFFFVFQLAQSKRFSDHDFVYIFLDYFQVLHKVFSVNGYV